LKSLGSPHLTLAGGARPLTQASEPAMRKQSSIFRYAAVRRYSLAQKKAVFPRVVRPVTLLSLWIALAILLCAAGFMGWYVRLRLS
jgi:hypothetical protein